MTVTIDTCYDGLGDAITYAWIASTAARNGSPITVNYGRWHDVASLLDVEPWATFEHGARYDTNKSGFSPHHLDEIEAVHAWQDGDGPMVTRFEAWCRHFGVDPSDPVRPMYAEEAADGDRAEAAWADVASGLAANGFRHNGVRVALCPTCNGRERTWPTPQWVDLGEQLLRSGLVPAAILPAGQIWDRMPAQITTAKLCNYFATLKRADVVVCNDSAAAHVAGTIGVPTLVISGLTDPRVVFAHMDGNVHWIANGDVGCSGCHWNGDRGYRPGCRSGCQSLIRLPVPRVLERIEEMLEVLQNEWLVHDR